MRKMLKSILIALLLMASSVAVAQYSIDKVCVGALRHYRIDGEPNSTYTWRLKDLAGNDSTLSCTADTVEILWNFPAGTYSLSCIQHSAQSCDAFLELGTVEVFAQPTAFAGNNSTLCGSGSFLLNEATAGNYSTLSWSTSGDGSFDDIHLLNPTYSPGTNDLISGVQLTLTTQGMGNSNACQPAVSSVFLHFSLLSIDSVTVTNATCGLMNGTLSIYASSLTGTTLSYSIDDGLNWSASNQFNNLAAGSYIVKVKGDSCELSYISNPVVITSIGGPAILAVNHTDASCGQNNGAIQISASGNNLMFSIDKGNTWSADSIFLNLPPGAYDIKVKDNYCVVEYPGNPVIVNTTGGPVILSVNSTNAVCNASNGSITISAEGTALMFSIDNGITWSTDSVFMNLQAGSYTIKVKDNNCETLYPGNPVIIQSLGGPQINFVNTTDASCGMNNGTITIIATGTGTLQYSINNGISWSVGSVFTGLAASNYYIRVKDDNCETVYENNPVTINSIGGPAITNVTSTDATCGQANGSISITATGMGTLLYSIDNGASWSSSSLFTGLSAGSYMVKVKDDFCETTYINNPVIISTTGGPVITSVTPVDASCGLSNGSITIVASGNGTLQYSINDGASWSLSGIFTGLPAGSYLVRVKDEACETPYLNNPVILNSTGGPQIISVITSNATCGYDNGSISITATGAGTLQYSIDNGSSWSINGHFNNLGAGTYSIRVKDDNCETVYTSNPVILTTTVSAMITLVETTNTSCGLGNGMIRIHTSGGDSLLFTIDNGLTWTTDSVFFNLPAGIYTISVKNGECISGAPNNPYVLTAIPLPNIDQVNVTPVSCHGGSNGSASAVVSGGTTPYTFQWNDANQQTTATAVDLAAGIYTLILTDANGCTDTTMITISQPDSSLFLDATIVHNVCYGDLMGSIDVQVSGGNEPYRYGWSHGGAGSHLENLASAVYELRITDAHGCTLDTMLTVQQPPRLVAQAQIVSPVPVMGGSATILVTAMGGTPNYTGIGEFFVNAGTYSFQVADSNGCIATTTIVVPDAGKLLSADTSACLGDHMSLPLMVYGFKDIVSFHLNLMYDPHIMEFTGFMNVDEGINSGLIIHPDLTTGLLVMDWSQSTPVTIADSGQLIQLIFRTVNAGKTALASGDSLNDDNQFINSSGQQILVQYSQGEAEVIRPAVIEIIGEQTLNYGDPLELMVMAWTGNPANYDWTSPTETGVSGYSYKIDHVTESDQGVYLVRVIDRNGCFSSDTATIMVGDKLLGRIEVPSGFTPNADGLNDEFLAYTNIDTKFAFKMLVFNKWGQQIFESSDITKGWDGTYKGQPCQSDLYTWVVYFQVPSTINMIQQSPLQGVVMLLR